MGAAVRGGRGLSQRLGCGAETKCAILGSP
ncbi:MAG: hypothetical protein RL635_1503, partial [Chloroflexota bacterium]